MDLFNAVHTYTHINTEWKTSLSFGIAICYLSMFSCTKWLMAHLKCMKNDILSRWKRNYNWIGNTEWDVFPLKYSILWWDICLCFVIYPFLSEFNSMELCDMFCFNWPHIIRLNVFICMYPNEWYERQYCCLSSFILIVGRFLCIKLRCIQSAGAAICQIVLHNLWTWSCNYYIVHWNWNERICRVANFNGNKYRIV